MNKLSKIILIMFIVIAILTAIVIATIVNKSKEPKEAKEKIETKVSEVILDECTDEYEIMKEESIITNSELEKLSPNAKIILTRYYKECKDSINEYMQIPEVLVNSTKDDLQSQYKDWEIKEFSSNQVILYKEFEGNCGQHYILRDEDGKIIIYKLLENGNESVYEKTDISIEYLPEKDKNSIKEGLRINSKEKLNELIENFE